MQRKKVGIIGTGHVGATIAYTLSIMGIADEIVLIDVNQSMTEGLQMDINHGIHGIDTADVFCGEYCDCKECDIIIIAAGRGRNPGEDRLQLIADNRKIIYSIMENIMPYYQDAVILMVSNPVDVLTYQVAQYGGIGRDKVIGTGCLLDVSRLSRLLAEHFQVGKEDVVAFVIGEHGESKCALWEETKIIGMELRTYAERKGFLWDNRIKDRMWEQMNMMGMEIIKRKGVTNYGIAVCVANLVDLILKDTREIVCVSTVLQGDYGVKGAALSTPVRIGKCGVIDRHFKLDENALANLNKAWLKIRKIL